MRSLATYDVDDLGHADGSLELHGSGLGGGRTSVVRVSSPSWVSVLLQYSRLRPSGTGWEQAKRPARAKIPLGRS